MFIWPVVSLCRHAWWLVCGARQINIHHTSQQHAASLSDLPFTSLHLTVSYFILALPSYSLLFHLVRSLHLNTLQVDPLCWNIVGKIKLW